MNYRLPAAKLFAHSSRYLYLTFLLILFASNVVFAQSTIKGKVIDASDKKPVPFATVFLNNTSIGTRTLDNGMFTLHNVKNGKYTVIISCIGYTAMKQEVFVKGETIKLAVIELKPTARQLSEVKIKPKKPLTPANIRNYTRWFLHQFLGTTPNAMECKLVNPMALEFDFNAKSGKFIVTASEPLVIENYALGYRITYLLQSFLWDQYNNLVNYTGFSKYDELPGSAEQQALWSKKRKKAYLGSQMHFFRACIANQVELNDFYVFKLTRTSKDGRPKDSLITAKINQFSDAGGPDDSLKYWWRQYKLPMYDQVSDFKVLSVGEYVNITNERGVFEFKYGFPLLINYKNSSNAKRPGSSIVTFVGKQAYFDNNGVIMDPLDLMISDYWQTLRVGDTLPYNYELPQNGS